MGGASRWAGEPKRIASGSDRKVATWSDSLRFGRIHWRTALPLLAREEISAPTARSHWIKLCSLYHDFWEGRLWRFL